MPLGYQRYLGQRQRTRAGVGGVSTGLLILGGIGLGLGLMYLLDPAIGRRQRALVRDRARGYWHRTEDLLGKTARQTQSRARGVVSGARQRLMGANIAADTALETRVRAHIGHVISHPEAIGVVATHQGCVSLSGAIPASEVEKLLATVKSVSGVTEVVNQLEVHQDATHISG
jgi:osmotically-inducible protein OsmY